MGGLSYPSCYSGGQRRGLGVYLLPGVFGREMRMAVWHLGRLRLVCVL